MKAKHAMKRFIFLTLGFLMLMAATAQAGYLTSGLERQLSDLKGEDTVKVLVVMSEQTDISSLNWELHGAKASLDIRHRTVVETLQGRASRTQVDLLASLGSDKAKGEIKGFVSHWIVNSVVVTGTVDAIRELAKRPDVERIEADLVVQLIEPVGMEKGIVADEIITGIGIPPGLTAIGVPRVWGELGIDGTGVVVGNMDTGVDGTHPALYKRWRGRFAPPSECWFDAVNLGDPGFPRDRHYHGTHTMGTITGYTPLDQIGVAPGARWIAANTIMTDSFPILDNAVIASLEFMADPDGNPATTIDVPAVVSNSWGVDESFEGYFDCDSRYWDAIDACEAAGVCLTWSAGNEGIQGSGTLRSPADRATSPTNSFSVGSTSYVPPYEISYFSSRGPSGCGGEFAMKPEVVAAGENIYSSIPVGLIERDYYYLSGTSMSGPHVAGVVALMKASNPDIDVITIKETLMATATDLGPEGEDNDYGHGLINAYDAVVAVMVGLGTVEGYITDSVTGLPIEGVLVKKVGVPHQVVTDAAGYYSMLMPSGDINLVASFYGYHDGAMSVSVPAEGTVTASLALERIPSSIVSGIVYDPDGNVVEGAVVRASNTPVSPTMTDVDGFYSLILPSGSGQFFFMVGHADGLGNQALEIELLADATVDFHLPEWSGDGFETGNFHNNPWEMNGATDWVIDSGDVHEGVFSAHSAPILDNQVSELSVTLDVLEPGEFKFWYKVSSEGERDFFSFLVDGALVGKWSGEVEWTQFTYPVAIPGSHTFAFVYDKNGIGSFGDDTVWVDLVEFPLAEQPGVAKIDVDTTPIAVNLAPDSMQDVPLLIHNLGEVDLDYTLNLVEVNSAKNSGLNPVVTSGAGGPDAFGYAWTDSDDPDGPVYDWVDISMIGSIAGNGDDVTVGPFPLQFAFPLYGIGYNSIRLCTNGWMAFDQEPNEHTPINQRFPDPAIPNNVIAPFWDDLWAHNGGLLYYRSEPTRFIVQWHNVFHKDIEGDGLPMTFQAILNEDGSIVYQYKEIHDVGESTVGIEDALGEVGLLVSYNDPDYIHSEMAVRIEQVPLFYWVTTDPLAGTVLPGESQEVVLHFDSTDLELGTYLAQLNIGANDPAQDMTTIDLSLTVAIVSPVEDPLLPRVVHFAGPVPNPFNPATDLKFSTPRDAVVTMKIYDVSGRLVRNLLNGHLLAGHHEVRWNGKDSGGRAVASGTYFARLVVGGDISVRSMVLVR